MSGFDSTYALSTFVTRANETNYSIKQDELLKSFNDAINALYQLFIKFLELSIEFMDLFNGNRLYWVWASSIVSMLFDLLPQLDEAADALDQFGTHTGRTSFILYYIRFFAHLFLLFAYTLKDDPNTQWQDRLAAQWDNRKYSLFNDGLWGPSNMTCFLWLTKQNGLDSWGDGLTLVLLLCDILISYWVHEDQKKAYETALESLKHDPVAYNKKKAEWEVKQNDLKRDCYYAMLLFGAFFVALLPLGPTGAILCFALTVINNISKVCIDLYRAYHAREEAKAAYENKLREFETCLTLTDEALTQALKDHQQLKAELDYHEDLLTLKLWALAPVLLPQLLIPALVLTIALLSPVGTVYAALISTLVITAILATVLGLVLAYIQKEKKEGLDEEKKRILEVKVDTEREQKTIIENKFSIFSSSKKDCDSELSKWLLI